MNKHENERQHLEPEEEHSDLPVKVGPHEPQRGVNLSGFELDMYRDLRGGGEYDESSGGGGFSLRDGLYVLFRHKWKIVFCFILCAIVSGMVVSAVPAFYESQAEVFVLSDRSSLTIDPAGGQNSFLQSSRPHNRVRSEIAILTGQKVAAEVVDRLGPNYVLGGPAYRPLDEQAAAEDAQGAEVPLPLENYEDQLNVFGRIVKSAQDGYAELIDMVNLTKPELSKREKAIRYIQGSMGVKETMSESNVLRVTLQSHHPEVAQKILDTLLDVYMKEHIDIHRMRLSAKFFEDEAQELQNQLEQKVTERDRLRKQLNITSLADQQKLLQDQMQKFRNEIHENDIKITATKTQIDLLQKKIEELPEKRTMQSTRQVDRDLLNRLRQLQLQRIDLQAIYKEGSPELDRIDRQIQSVRNMIEKEMTEPTQIVEGLDPTRLKLIEELESAQTSLAMLEKQKELNQASLQEVERQREELREHEPELGRLETEAAQLQRKYQQFQDSKNVAEIAETLDSSNIANVKVIQQASWPIGSTKNIRKLTAVLLFGIAMGLALGLALAFGLEFFDHTLKTAEDVEKRLGLPVLVSIPVSRNPKPKLLKDAT